MSAIEPNLQALIVFAAAWSICCSGAILLSGLLPLSAAPAEVKSGGGTVLIIADGALLLLATVLTLIFCVQELRWSSAVIAGGLIFLTSPFVTQDLPETFKYSRGGLALLLALLCAVFVLLLALGTYPPLKAILHVH